MLDLFCLGNASFALVGCGIDGCEVLTCCLPRGFLATENRRPDAVENVAWVADATILSASFAFLSCPGGVDDRFRIGN